MRDLYYTLDRTGNPQPVESGLDWARWFERSWPARKVAQVILPLDRTRRIFVSAVFLGMNHNWFPEDDARPILYEMMAFTEEFARTQGRGTRRGRRPRVKRLLDAHYQRRFRTNAEARAMFDHLVRFLIDTKASWGSTPTEAEVVTWFQLFDVLDESSQSENRSAEALR